MANKLSTCLKPLSDGKISPYGTFFSIGFRYVSRRENIVAAARSSPINCFVDVYESKLPRKPLQSGSRCARCCKKSSKHIMRKIYSYIFYRTYRSTFKAYPTNAILRTSGFLSVFLLFNIMSNSLFFEEFLTKQNFKLVLILATIVCFLNLIFLNERNAKLMIHESEYLKVKKVWKYAIDFYPQMSILLFLIAVKASITTIVLTFGIYLMYKLVDFLQRCSRGTFAKQPFRKTMSFLVNSSLRFARIFIFNKK